MLVKRISTYSDGTWAVEQFDTEPPVQMYMHKEDRDLPNWNWGIRPCAPCPAIMILLDDQHAIIDQQWQYYTRAINYNMTLENVYLLFDDHLAYANDSGFINLDNPGRADYFFNRDLDKKPPQMDKVRTNSRNVLTGMEDGNELIVTLFDSREPPPLKPGRSYPKDISEVNPDDYLYNPKDHPWMFLVANIVNRRGEVVPFPRGATYPWFEDGNTPVSFLPHIHNYQYGEVRYPLSKLIKLPLGSAVPSPYRRNPSLVSKVTGFVRLKLRAGLEIFKNPSRGM